MTIASVLYAFLGLALRVVSLRAIPMIHALVVRSAFATLVTTAMLQQDGLTTLTAMLGPLACRKAVYMRSILGFVGMTAYFYAAALLHVGENTALAFTAPIFCSIFASIFLGSVTC